MSNAKTATEKYVDEAIAAAAGGGGTDTVAWGNVTDKPSFATVATSGSYNDLLNKPTIPAPVDISGKADKSEVYAALAQKADADALPYALVVPGEWSYSEVPSGWTVTGLIFSDGQWTLYLYDGDAEVPYGAYGNGDELTLSFNVSVGGGGTVVATRASLPGHLCDRAANAVSVTGATTLTLPAANPGHARDLYVRLTVSATSAVTWEVAQGESWDALGAPPSSFAAGTYLYRFTEVAAGVWHCDDMLALVGLDAALAAINGGVAP